MNLGLLTPENDGIINWVDPINWLHPLNLGLVSWWLAIPGAMGGATWQDLCRRNHGTLTGMDPAEDWVSGGRPGGSGALDFDGSNDRVSIPSHPVFDVTQITVNVWVKPGVLGTLDRGIVAKWKASKGWILWTFNNDIHWGDNVSQAVTLTNGQDLIEDGNWHMLTGVRGTTNMRLYVDGVEKASGINNVMEFSSIPINIGSYDEGGGAEFIGQLDNVRISNRALSAAEVKLEYQLDQQGSPGLLNRIQPWYYAPAADGLYLPYDLAHQPQHQAVMSM